jgi:excisionase family DNA binding protein
MCEALKKRFSTSTEVDTKKLLRSDPHNAQYRTKLAESMSHTAPSVYRTPREKGLNRMGFVRFPSHNPRHCTIRFQQAADTTFACPEFPNTRMTKPPIGIILVVRSIRQVACSRHHEEDSIHQAPDSFLSLLVFALVQPSHETFCLNFARISATLFSGQHFSLYMAFCFYHIHECTPTFWLGQRIMRLSQFGGVSVDTLLSVEEAARRLGGISKWTLHAWLSQGRLQRTKVGSRTMIRESELQKVIDDGGKSPAPGRPDETV